LALILGFALVLVVGIAISDHFSRARVSRMGGAGGEISTGGSTNYGDVGEALPAPLGTRPGEAVRYSSKELAEAEPRIKAPDAGASAAPDIITMKPVEPQAQARPAAPPGAAPSPAVEPEQAKPISKGRLRRYAVKKGEGLYTIASAMYGNGNLWRELAAYNKGRVGPEGKVAEGVTIMLPPKDVLLGEAVLAPEGQKAEPDGKRSSPSTDAGERMIAGITPKKETKAKPGAPKYTEYKVQPGDRLSEILQRIYGSGSQKRLAEVMKLNALEDADSVRAGVTLKFPAR
jgi:nucleoid-associated protein YgaU